MVISCVSLCLKSVMPESSGVFHNFPCFQNRKTFSLFLSLIMKNFRLRKGFFSKTWSGGKICFYVRLKTTGLFFYYIQFYVCSLFYGKPSSLWFTDCYIKPENNFSRFRNPFNILYCVQIRFVSVLKYWELEDENKQFIWPIYFRFFQSGTSGLFLCFIWGLIETFSPN